MALITTVIPTQAYEAIRDRIASILAVELAEQVALRGLTIDIPVFTERYAKVDAVETPCIIVSLARGDYQNQDPTVAQGDYVFNIDAYASAKNTLDSSGQLIARGDTASVIFLEGLLGICRAIIQDANYYRLDFPPSFIARRQIQSIETATPATAQDVNDVVMGRLQLGVTAAEQNGMQYADLIGDWQTVVNIDQTNAGYVFTASS